MIDPVEICSKVLARLNVMGYEKTGRQSDEQLIFPQKVQAKGTKTKDRISEQELRLLFIEEFKKAYPGFYYSIETPTKEKYSFGKTLNDIKTDVNGQSASLDMCVFERKSSKYERILNIEFKHKNTVIKNIAKDILKLIHENQDGAFIHLLDNTNRGTFCKDKETGVFNKLHKSFTDFQATWNNDKKSIQIIILSLNQKTLIHRSINKSDLNKLNKIFFLNDKNCGNIKTIEGNGWGNESLV